MTTLFLCGSMKPGPGRTEVSASREMLKEVLKGAESVEEPTSWVDLRTNPLPWWTGAPEQTSDPNVRVLVDALKEADRVVVSVPGYWNGISGVVKNIFDVTGRKYWQNKCVSALVVGMNPSSAWYAADDFMSIVSSLGAWVAPNLCVIEDVRTVSNQADLVKDLRRYGVYSAKAAPGGGL